MQKESSKVKRTPGAAAASDAAAQLAEARPADVGITYRFNHAAHTISASVKAGGTVWRDLR